MATVSVLRACNINGKPVQPGDTVDVSGPTLANLLRKGWLKEGSAKAEAPQQSLEQPEPLRKRKATP